MKTSLLLLLTTLCCVHGYAASREKSHWVGVANIKYNSAFSREYTSQIVSLTPSPMDSDSWYIEIGKATCANSRAKCDDAVGIGRVGGHIKGDVNSFFKSLKTKFALGGYYFEGSATNLDSAISGRIYEKGTNLLAGYFEFNARHDGSDSFGFAISPSDLACFQTEKPSQTACYGSGAP